jgi:hypothetical protein
MEPPPGLRTVSLESLIVLILITRTASTLPISHQLRHYNVVTKFAIEHGFSISCVRRPAFTEN